MTKRPTKECDRCHVEVYIDALDYPSRCLDEDCPLSISSEPVGTIITPEIAEAMLATLNDGGWVQTPCGWLVNALAKMMREGRWEPALARHNPITLTAGGKLLDGRHRMLAVIEANQSLEFFVVTAGLRLPPRGYSRLPAPPRRSPPESQAAGAETAAISNILNAG